MADGYDNTLAAVYAMLHRHSRIGDYIFIAYILASAVFLVFVGLMFSLMNAAIVAEHRLVTLNALGLTSGHVGELFAGMATIFVPLIVVFSLALHWLAPQIRFVHAWPHIEGSPLLFWVYDGFNTVIIFVLWPLIVGFFASAYSQITEIREYSMSKAAPLSFDFALEGFRIIRERPKLIAFWGALCVLGN
eukprot:gene19426-24591_t